MNSLYLKIAGGTTALGALGTATYFGGKELLRPSTVKEKLSKEGFKFILSSDTKQWEEEFNSDGTAIKTVIGNIKADANALKAWCESKYGLTNFEQIDLINVKKYCVIRDVKSQLLRKGKKLLVGLDGDDVAGKWTATIQKRKENNKGGDKLKLTGAWDASENLEKIKSWCNTNSKVNFLAKEDTYTLVEAWCTEEGKDITLN